MSARNARASRRSRLMDMNNPMYPPVGDLVDPRRPRAKSGTVGAKKTKLAAFRKAQKTGRSLRSFKPLSASTEAYATRKKEAARKRYAGRTDVIGRQMARAAMREQRATDASAERAARALKRRRAAARGPINVMTMSPGTIEAILGRRIKVGAGALARRMRDPAFAARYKQKMLGRRYRQGGRLLGADYRAPVEKRKTTRMVRKQGGVGLKAKYGDLIGLGMNTSLMRMGDYASKASLMDYADMMRKKAQAAYLRKTGKAAVRTKMTASAKKKKRADAYKAKKEARKRVVSPLTFVSNNSSRMSSIGALSNIGNISAQFSPAPPSPPRTRGSATVAMAKAAAAARRASIPQTTRRTRSMAPPLRRSTRGRK